MSSKEMKKQLIDKILSTDDHTILEEVYRILEVSTQEIDMIMLTDDQKSEIDKGIKDIEEGRYLTNEAANSEIIEWLKK
jgi:predicted transcriptional regulator